MACVVSPSSVSDGWKTDASGSPARFAADLDRSQTSIPSSDQPCDRQAFSRSRRDSVREMYRHALPGPDPAEDELEGDGRLPRPGVALDEVEALAEEPAHQHVVEARHPGGHVFRVIHVPSG